MAMRIVDSGEVAMLTAIMNTLTPLSLRLFVSNSTPAEGNTLATYTEMSGAGYAAISIPSTAWTISSGSPAQAVCDAKEYLFTGSSPTPVYGYFLVHGTTLIAAERFSDGPYSINGSGNRITITPTITLKDSLDG